MSKYVATSAQTEQKLSVASTKQPWRFVEHDLSEKPNSSFESTVVQSIHSWA